MSDAFQNLRNTLDAPELLRSSVGQVDVTLPCVDGLVLIGESSLGISFEKGEISSNLVFAHPGRRCSHPLRINYHAGAARNTVVLGKGAEIYGQLHIHGSDNVVILSGGTSHWSMVNARLWGSKQVFLWGLGATSNGCDVVMQGDGRKVLVSDDCMFANGIYVRNSDMHPVVDLQTKEWLNPPDDVVVGSHVWVAQEVLIGKGVLVGRGSVIGAKAFVNRSIPPFCLAGGAPARVLKSGISWDRDEFPRREVVDRLSEEYLQGQP
ncbi:acyltransferase [Pseudoxanthomonas sp. Root630]|uniref:acyltransferase n=1 Tax=Pseudoxanthomonas sp. Root630 TaxID=1736574 RepID=UPI000AFDF3FC|nr:acyltransferase [Pseudoxanthomonas sp. Root630]